MTIHHLRLQRPADFGFGSAPFELQRDARDSSTAGALWLRQSVVGELDCAGFGLSRLCPSPRPARRNQLGKAAINPAHVEGRDLHFFLRPFSGANKIAGLDAFRAAHEVLVGEGVVPKPGTPAR
jgi:hypothetical protein